VEAEAQFRSLAEPWADTGTSTGRLMIAVLGGLADVERDLTNSHPHCRRQEPRQGSRTARGPPPFPHTGAAERGHQTPRAGRYVTGIGRQLRPQHFHHAPRDKVSMNRLVRITLTVLGGFSQMADGVRHWWRLNQLQREKRAVRALLGPLVQKAIEEKNAQILSELTDKELHDIFAIDEKIAAFQTTFLTDEAQRLGLIVPSFTDSGLWEKAVTAPTYHLKDEAIVALRSAVRKEKKERREVWQSWVTLTIGVIGALIGFVSVLKK
jgi:hypothetical protein